MDVGASWHDFLTSHAAEDLLMVARGQRLRYGNAAIQLHWLDRVTLMLIRQAYLQQQSLVLCYPVPVCNLPMLAAAQLLVHDFIQNYPGRLSVLLMSRRTEVRQHYLNLMIGRERLASVLPLARIRSAGEPAVISVPDSKTGDVPRLYHLSQSHLLDAPWPKRIGAIIVDHAGGDFGEETAHIHELAARRRISTVVHLCSDPFTPFLQELTDANIPIWVWDHCGLASDFGEQVPTGNGSPGHPFGVSARQFQNIISGIHHHIVVCQHVGLETAARCLWDDLGTIQHTFSGQAGLGIRRAIRAAYGAFYTMLQMLVPLPVYEEEARNLWGIRPISRRIADLEAFTSLLRDEAPDLAEIYWPSLILDLKEMQEALAAGNPKYDTLVQQIREHQEQKKDLVVVCPNRATKRMLQLCLRAREGLRLGEVEEMDGRSGVLLKTYQEIPTIETADSILFPGQFSYGRRQFVLTAAAPETRYLTYGDEADRIEQQVTGIHQTLAEKAGAEERSRAWALLRGQSGELPDASRGTSISAIEFTRSEGGKVSRRAVAAMEKPALGIWTPFSTHEYDLVQGRDVLTTDSEEALRPSEFAEPQRQSVIVSALCIEFVDGYCYAEPDSQMTVFLTATGKTDERKVHGLRPEDLVLFVDNDQQRQLYEAILERIERHPAMGATHILARYWQQAIREGFFRSGMTYDQFLRRLRARGSQIETTTAIYFWVRGWVLGPRDGEDIRRIGEVLDDQTLVQEWKDINRAVRKVRSLHLSLARKLDKIIIQAGLRGQHSDAADECVDRELGLYLDDFRDSVALHRIVAISQDISPVPYVFTGRFFAKGTELTW
jgi:hypothetical protein